MPTRLQIVLPSHLDPEPQAETKCIGAYSLQAPEARQKFTIFLQRLARHGGAAIDSFYWWEVGFRILSKAAKFKLSS